MECLSHSTPLKRWKYFPQKIHQGSKTVMEKNAKEKENPFVSLLLLELSHDKLLWCVPAVPYNYDYELVTYSIHLKRFPFTILFSFKQFVTHS